MKYLFVLGLLLWTVNTFAQYTQKMVVPSIYIPEYTLTGDVDMDGDNDILVCSARGSKQINWYENEGAGNFAPSRTISTDENGFSAIYLEDLNGDGLDDVVALSYIGDEIVWFENRGNGSFGLSSTIISDFRRSENLAFGDIDDDGDTDLFLFSVYERTVAYLLNDGTGHFGGLRIIEEGFIQPNFGAVEDVNGDGRVDVVVAYRSGKLSWYENLESGGFGSEQIITSEVADPIRVRIEDMDKDSDMDLVVVSIEDMLTWHENDGSANFETHTISSNHDFEEVAIADINGDEWLDIVCSIDGTQTQVDKIRCFVNNGNGNYTFQQNLPTVGDAPPIISLADLNGDDLVDIAYPNETIDRIDWHSQEADGLFSNVNTIGKYGWIFTSVFNADLNGDGYIDIALAEGKNGVSGKLTWLVNEGNNQFDKQVFISEDTFSFEDLKGGDLDLDGDIDLVSSTYNGVITWWINDGEGNFEAQEQVENLESAISDLQVGDVNGDSYPDIVAYDLTNQALLWYANVEGNYFISSKTVTNYPQSNGAIHILDIDENGSSDILHIPLQGTQIYYYAYGNNDFTRHHIITTDEKILTSEFEDFDNDGLKDIVLSQQKGLYDTDSWLIWYKNNGNGSFEYKEELFGQFGMNTEINQIALADFDGDLDNDIIINSKKFLGLGDATYLLSNQGNGEFSLFNLTAEGEDVYPSLLEAVDLEGDGNAELLHFYYGIMRIFNDFENFGQIHGTAFFDENENGSYDEEEFGFQGVNISLNLFEQEAFTNSNGDFSFWVPIGEHQLSSHIGSLWELTTLESTYDITIVDGEIKGPYLFGFKPTRLIPRAAPHLSSGPTRCNSQVSYWLTYSNTGTTIAKGRVTLEIDELMGFTSSNPAPDLIEEGQLIWNFSGLPPMNENQIKLQFQMPDFNSIGEILETQATVQLFNDSQELVYTKTTTYDSEVRCAYDPNDKLVRSNLLGQSESAYIADTVLYTIRFQNTGNDVAFNIRVEDVLGKKLDWTTFHPITASHDYHTELNRETGLVTFYFDDIMLPDSTSNEPESHGFVLFGIASLPDIGDKTGLENTASIFFDFNPPIITNTVNTVLIELDDLNADNQILDNGYSIRVYPNPFSDYTTIEIEGLPEGVYQLEVMDILGRKVRTLTLEEGKMRLERGVVESGVYLWRILEEGNLKSIGIGKVLIR